MSNETEQANQDQHQTELVDSIRSCVETFFSTHIGKLFEIADETIFKQGEAAGSVAEQNSLFEFMNDLLRQKVSFNSNRKGG